MSDQPKNDVYDSQILPLLKQITEVAKAHNINFVAAFDLDETEIAYRVASVMVVQDAKLGDLSPTLRELLLVVFKHNPELFARIIIDAIKQAVESEEEEATANE